MIRSRASLNRFVFFEMMSLVRPSVRTSTGGSKRSTWVPSASRQLDEGITGLR